LPELSSRPINRRQQPDRNNIRKAKGHVHFRMWPFLTCSFGTLFLTRAPGIPQIAIHSVLRQAEIRGDLGHLLPLVIELINTLCLGQSHRVRRARSWLVGRLLLNSLNRRSRGSVRGNRCSRKRTGYRNTHKTSLSSYTDKDRHPSPKHEPHSHHFKNLTSPAPIPILECRSTLLGCHSEPDASPESLP